MERWNEVERSIRNDFSGRHVLVVVAHPDDETLWSGGIMLMNPGSAINIASLCRASDRDRAPKFVKATKVYGAVGSMGDLDDGPEQTPLDEMVMCEAILSQLDSDTRYDLILTHSPRGEYTRHRRHEEVGNAVASLWRRGRLETSELWFFAFEDGGGEYTPRAIRTADRVVDLPPEIWLSKYRIITETYGFPKEGFEARCTPKSEAFWRFTNPVEVYQRIERGDFDNESSHDV